MVGSFVGFSVGGIMNTGITTSSSSSSSSAVLLKVTAGDGDEDGISDDVVLVGDGDGGNDGGDDGDDDGISDDVVVVLVGDWFGCDEDCITAVVVVVVVVLSGDGDNDGDNDGISDVVALSSRDDCDCETMIVTMMVESRMSMMMERRMLYHSY